jgi:hypothetical protein
LLGPLGDRPRVAAECKFVDPVSDLAVLGGPDEQRFSVAFSDYENLLASTSSLRIAGVNGKWGEESRGWVLSLAGVWFACKVVHHGGGLFVSEAGGALEGGMSGSPILRDNGRAIGVVSSSSAGDDDIATAGGPHPRLTHHLPGWAIPPRRVN